MKTKILIIVLFSIFQFSNAQKLISKTGHIWFYSHTPMEDIEGHNHQVVSIFDLSTGDLMFNLLIKAFDFKIALMQEHFNENYMESDQFPKAVFKGKVINFEKIDFNKDGTYTAEVAGDITIHGVTKTIVNTGTIEVKSGLVSTKAKFNISPKDYNILIPSVVENKIAKEVEVTVDVAYNSN